MNLAKKILFHLFSLLLAAEFLQDSPAIKSGLIYFMATKTYSEKLRDPRWQKKRLQILERDEWMCQNCGSAKNTLHVHHKYYETGKQPWEYENECFITLCEDCHERETSELIKYSQLFLETFKKSEFFADDLRELAHGLSKLKIQHISGVVACAYSFALSDKDMQKFIIAEYFKDLKNRNGKKVL